MRCFAAKYGEPWIYQMEMDFLIRLVSLILSRLFISFGFVLFFPFPCFLYCIVEFEKPTIPPHRVPSRRSRFLNFVFLLSSSVPTAVWIRSDAFSLQFAREAFLSVRVCAVWNWVRRAVYYEQDTLHYLLVQNCESAQFATHVNKSIEDLNLAFVIWKMQCEWRTS